MIVGLIGFIIIFGGAGFIINAISAWAKNATKQEPKTYEEIKAAEAQARAKYDEERQARAITQ